MTRGTVVVLGAHGRNLGAGMTGGEAFLLEPDERLVNPELVDLVELESEDEERLRHLLERHLRATGSLGAEALLAGTDELARRFRRLVPRTLVVDRTEEVEGRLTA
jgi:glutamate synthase (NADPH/NADH) large chain